MDATLILNANCTPISILPLSTTGWQDAIAGVWVEAVTALHYYDDWAVHSPSTVMKVPSVVMLREQVTVRRRLSLHGMPSAPLVFLRDLFTCQYCELRFPRNALTLDHVIPRKYGGTSEWHNLSTACEKCNHTRGHNTRIQPKRQPVRPEYDDLLSNLYALDVTVPHESWTYYLKWPPKQVTVSDPRHRRSRVTNFDLERRRAPMAA